MEYTLQGMRYDMFLAERIYEQAEMERFIDECVLIGEGTNNIRNISILNESFVDKIKSGIKKLIEAIAKMWHKFLEAMNTLLKRDRAYLEKYKDVILKKKMVDSEYNMYDYFNGSKVLVNSPVPVLNLVTMQDDLESDEKFIGIHFSKFTQGVKSPYNLSDLAKSKFRGGNEKPIKATEINMTDVYNYCYNYNKLEDVIKKDITTIQKAATDALNTIDKMARNNEIQRESNIFDTPKYFSTVYEAYIHEEEAAKEVKPDNNGNGNVKPGAATRVTPNSNNNQSNNNPDDNPASAYKKASGETNSEEEIKDTAKDKTAKEFSEKINRYLRICGEFLGAKQTVSEEAYKAYMSIIRAHVRDHVGSKDSADNKPKDVGSDYNKTGEDNSNGNTGKEKAPDNKSTEGNNGNDNKSFKDKAKEKIANNAQAVADFFNKK